MNNNNTFKTKTGIALKLLSNKNCQTLVVIDNYEMTKNTKLAREQTKITRDLTLPQFLMLRNQGIKLNPSRVQFFEVQDIQLALVQKNIEVSAHAQQQMAERGYSKKDAI